ncbi:nitric oxide reductase activation protein NorD [Sideroxydans lithotrophicus]|uniref:von Willebrand factor type A n=1 Tax=Sideroxydans lithotrophicus (strain ES-1) TaxID=580332 RepID=D5CQX9_SIDLE|nr:VWA domain-containing protein [Sideroxydans lithotrophicus]ADE11365.1 von Willebrand factor type A [Sideroxydans lithotrophicus ES-1]
MEEYVGALWHRLITGVADKRYPAEAVSLEQISKTAGILFRSWGGDSGLAVKSATATQHGAKRTLLQRIAGSNLKTELTWLDGETLNLPATIAFFPERELNRDLYIWLIAMAAASTASTQPWIQRNQQATLEVLERFPGLKRRYQRLADAALAIRPEPASLPNDERAQEEAIRAALKSPGSVKHLPPARRAPQPVYLWLHPDPPASKATAALSKEPQNHEGGNNIKNGKDRRHQAERVDMPEDKNSFMMSFRAESIFSWAEYIKVNRPTEEDEPADDRPAEDLDRLSVAQDGKTAASRLKFDLDLPSAASDDQPLGKGILLPEWHYKKQLLQPAHCCLQPMVALKAEALPLPAHLSATARRLRSQFAALTPAKVWFKGQFDGSELDLDACVQFSADRIGGLQAREQGLYKAHQYRDRDLACLLLADLSLSTDAYVNDQARVIDVIRDTLFLFSEALSATGDRFALYGFSSLKRENIRFHILKEFERKYNDEVRGRIAAIKPGFYTRMGAAIRHASQLLAKQATTQRLLLILTDGKPNDLDQYEGRYGVEDTRVAIHEARQMGLRPFCVTIDEKGSSYLPHLFGVNGYVVIRNPSELPRELPLLYAQLTR